MEQSQKKRKSPKQRIFRSSKTILKEDIKSGKVVVEKKDKYILTNTETGETSRHKNMSTIAKQLNISYAQANKIWRADNKLVLVIPYKITKISEDV